MQPSKIVCVGRSYAAHAQELGNAVPEQPILFIKPPSSVVSYQDGIRWNHALGSCHYECELVLRIDRPLSNVHDLTEALAAVGAISLGLDLTLRDVQSQLKAKGLPWERAKAFDGACVLGDWISVDQVADLNALEFQFYVNDELRQHGDTRLLLFKLAELIAEISQCFSLAAGDLIMTGTPAGVGALNAGQQLKMVLPCKDKTYQWLTEVH